MLMNFNENYSSGKTPEYMESLNALVQGTFISALLALNYGDCTLDEFSKYEDKEGSTSYKASIYYFRQTNNILTLNKCEDILTLLRLQYSPMFGYENIDFNIMISHYTLSLQIIYYRDGYKREDE